MLRTTESARSVWLTELEQDFPVKTKKRHGYVPFAGGRVRALERYWVELEARLPVEYWATITLVNKSDYAAVLARARAASVFAQTLPQITPTPYPSLLLNFQGRRHVVTVTTLSKGGWLV